MIVVSQGILVKIVLNKYLFKARSKDKDRATSTNFIIDMEQIFG